MSFLRKQLGQSGEILACQFLKSKGFRILARNLRFKFGEIDILAEKGEDVILVEVKTKASKEFGEPVEEVDYFKKRKLSQLARAISQKYPNKNIRIDVVSVKINNQVELKHIENAVEF